VSLGSTPSLLAAGPLRSGITEMRPGTYAFNDLQQARWAAASERWQDGLEHAAAHVLASVVSVHGLTVARLSEEHGVVEGPGVERLYVGDKVRILMNHVCPVVNPFPVMHLARGDEVVEALPVEGRGRLT